MLCQQHWWLVSSLFSHYFPILRFFLQKPLADFPVLGGPKGLTFDFSFSNTSRFHLFKPTFWLLSFLSFFLNGLIPFYQTERFSTTFLHGPSFWVPRGTRPLFMSCWFPSLLFLFCIIGCLMGHIWPRSLCFWECSLSCLSLNLAMLNIPRIPGFWEFLGILVQLSPLRAGLQFFFSLFSDT